MEEQARNKNILKLSKAEQYQTVNELFARSEPSAPYYLLLALSTIIITAGLLLNNAAIVIGGMVVVPVLTPLLVVGLALAVGEIGSIKNIAILLAKSFAFLLVCSLVFTFLFGFSDQVFQFDNTVRTVMLYFIVAICSGIAGAFGWARKEISETLPGIAISVSVAPPLILTGIWLSVLNFEVARFYFMVFVLNILGIIVGSLIIFSLLKFYRTGSKVHEKATGEPAPPSPSS
jgi:uncharacterized hydrophobic protein (TIGR00341 family)